jgi:hypothetical protein
MDLNELIWMNKSYIINNISKFGHARAGFPGYLGEVFIENQ